MERKVVVEQGVLTEAIIEKDARRWPLTSFIGSAVVDAILIKSGESRACRYRRPSYRSLWIPDTNCYRVVLPGFLSPF